MPATGRRCRRRASNATGGGRRIGGARASEAAQGRSQTFIRQRAAQERSPVSETADSESIAARIRAEVDRALQRNIKGLEYLGSSGPRLGATPRDLLHQRGT